MIFLPGSVAGSIQTLGIQGDFEVFRTSIYGLSSTVSNWLALSGFGSVPSSAVWQVYLPNNSEFLNTQQTNFAYGYLSGGGNSAIDASLVPLSARLLVSVLGGTYFSKNVVPLKPYDSPSDIPNLRLWLDASDENTVNGEFLFTSFTEEFYSWGFGGFSNVLVNNTSSFTLGTGDFTIEFYCNYNNVSIDNVYSRRFLSHTNNSSSGIQIYSESPGNITFYTNTDILQTTMPLNDNKWHHVAFLRSSGVLSVYVDGVLDNSVSFSTNLNSTAGFYIGRHASSSSAGRYIGALSNYRIIKGSAVLSYPTIPLTAVGGPGTTTEILLFQNTILNNDGNTGNTLTITGSLNSTAVSKNIINWLDKSPNALTASQSIINNQTTLLSAEINNLNVLNFDGIDDFLTLSAPIALSSNFTHFFVYQRKSNDITSHSLGNIATNSQSPFLHWTNDNDIYSGSRSSTSPVLSTGVLIGGVRKNEYLQLDLTPVPFTGSWSSTTTIVDKVGAYKNINGSFYHQGLMGEIIHTSSMLPNQEIDLVNRKLYDKWKIPKTPPYNKVPQIVLATSISALSTTLGTWAVEPTGFSIQWQKSNDNSIYTNIPLATSTVYTLTGDNYGFFIRTSISASNNIGTSLPSFSDAYGLGVASSRTSISYTVSGYALSGTDLNNLPKEWYLGNNSSKDRTSISYTVSGYALSGTDLNNLPKEWYIGNNSSKDRTSISYTVSGYALSGTDVRPF